MTKYVRHRHDGTREVVYWSGGEPVWVEGEPAWHGWLVIVVYCVVLPCLGIGALIWHLVTP